MNELIKELADQADIGWLLEYHPKLEKFAELIVRECATVADHWVMFDEGPLQYGPVGEKIKEHFGGKDE